MLNKFVLLLIYLTATTFSGCADAPKFPEEVRVWETAYVPATQEWFCGEYKITDPRNLKYTPVMDHPITMCRGVFGFKGEDAPKLLDYMGRLEKYYKTKLEECRN